jgi:hypothetical protein
MSLVVKYEKKEYTPAPEGLLQAVCVDVVDLGVQDTPWGQKHKCRIWWQVEEINPDTGKRHTLRKDYTVSLHEKAGLRKDLETWRSRKFSEEELSGFDLEKLLGVNCQLQVVHTLSDDGRTFANVQAIVGVNKNMVLIRAQDYVRVKDRPAEQPSNVRPIAQAAGGGSAANDDDSDVPF